MGHLPLVQSLDLTHTHTKFGSTKGGRGRGHKLQLASKIQGNREPQRVTGVCPCGIISSTSNTVASCSNKHPCARYRERCYPTTTPNLRIIALHLNNTRIIEYDIHNWSRTQPPAPLAGGAFLFYGRPMIFDAKNRSVCGRVCQIFHVCITGSRSVLSNFCRLRKKP